jgi:tRNA-(ms[2]io[6]A)-hydroxylase
LFLDLAKTYASPEMVQERWVQYLNYESDLLQQMALRGDRMH